MDPPFRKVSTLVQALNCQTGWRLRLPAAAADDLRKMSTETNELAILAPLLVGGANHLPHLIHNIFRKSV